MRTVKPTAFLPAKLSGLVLGLLFSALSATPASATIYQFAIPISTFQSAVASLVGSPDTYVIYDVYMRATLASDLGHGTLLPSPYNVNATPPAVSPDAWTDVINGKVTNNDGIKGPGDTAPYQSIHFTYGANANIAVIVNKNATDGAVVGKTVNGHNVGELVPNTSQFVLDISSPTSGLQGNTYKIYFFAYADQFSDNTYSTSANKAQIIEGSIDVTATLTPEPASIFMGGSGFLLLAIAGIRRRRNRS